MQTIYKKARWKSSFFVQCCSTDEGEGQRKRKNEVSEEKPAKRLSICTEDNKSDTTEVADTAANALQNLTLAKKAEEQHVEGHADAAITEHKEPVELKAPTCDSIGSEHTPEGGRSDQAAGRMSWNWISGIFISD